MTLRPFSRLFFVGSPYGEYRARRVADDSFGYAPNQHTFQASFAMCPHHNEIYSLPLRQDADLGSRITAPKHHGFYWYGLPYGDFLQALFSISPQLCFEPFLLCHHARQPLSRRPGDDMKENERRSGRGSEKQRPFQSLL